jgi:hypothetical protein
MPTVTNLETQSLSFTAVGKQQRSRCATSRPARSTMPQLTFVSPTPILNRGPRPVASSPLLPRYQLARPGRVVTTCGQTPPSPVSSDASIPLDADTDGMLGDAREDGPSLSVDGTGHTGDIGGGNRGGFGSSGGGGGGSSGSSGERQRHLAVSALMITRKATSAMLSKTSSFMLALFQNVPTQVLTAIFGVLSGVYGQQKRAESEKRAEERSAREQAARQRAKTEQKLREKYQAVHGPLLMSAAKLSERIYTLVYGSGAPAWREDGEPYSGVLYSAYLFSRYFAMVEIVKRKSEVLDLGFPAADRVFTAVLGRIQGVLSADDCTLRHLQRTENYFLPAPGERPVPGGFVTLCNF